MPTRRAARLSLDLDRTFSAPRMQRVWTQTVRTGLRRQAIHDLHDFLDVHRNLRSYIERLRTDIVGGRYRPRAPEVIRLEKRDGICRRILLPSPGDALILQTLVEVFQPLIKAKQPTENAYYSRSHDGPTITDVDETFGYPWWDLWPEFQKRIWKFSDLKPYTVVADIANYFDSIPLASLRNIIAGMGSLQESLLDFLFFMLEAFTWRPFYMPLSGVGLPQVDFDAPRLLAHAYLFDADRELHSAVGDNFVRWMDDINFGVDSPVHGRRVLGQLEHLLNSYGLRLNAGKTRILDAEQAGKYFWIETNRELNVIQHSIEHGALTRPGKALATRSLKKKYDVFFQQEKIGHSGKIQKRFFTLFGKLGDDYLQVEVPELLESSPDLRQSVLRYYAQLGYSPCRYEHLHDYLVSGKCIDDASIFQAVRTLVDWNIPLASGTQHKLTVLAAEMMTACDHTAAAVTAGVWLMAKYSSALELEEFLNATYPIWRKSEWTGRQVAAATPRLTPRARAAVKQRLTWNGLLDGLGVVAHLEQLGELTSLDRQLRAYLFAVPKHGHVYPLGKVLLAMVLLDGQSPVQERIEWQKSIAALTDDEVYHELLSTNRLRLSIPILAGTSAAGV